MRILIDIGHPAHVHYFKNFIWIMQNKGHEFVITARNRGEIFKLLNAYGFKYFDRGHGGRGFLGKIAYLLNANLLLLKIAKKFEPDLYLSFGSMYAAQVSKYLKKIHIAFDDTEHSKFEHLLYAPFTDQICVPSCFKKVIRKTQLYFDGHMELCYLHPSYYSPDPCVLEMLGVGANDPYSILRFVSWSAGHDTGQTGITIENKYNAVRVLSKYGKVFISSEGHVPDDLKQFKINIPPEKMHDALYFANLYFGEGATMASECAMLGTPAIYINSLTAGTLENHANAGRIFSFRNDNQSIEKAEELMKLKNLKAVWQAKRRKMLNETIDVTAFMVWLIENFPESTATLIKNPDFQSRFKTDSVGKT